MKQLLRILICLLGITTFGQDVNTEIKNDFSEYYRLVSEKKVDMAMNYTNPKIFEIIPKEQMKSLILAVYQIPNMEFKTGDPTFTKFEELKRIENVNYVRFTIISPLEIKFTDMEIDEEKVSQLITNFESKFGVGNVTFDEKTGFYKINAEKIIVANSDDELKDWQFITIDNPRMKSLLKKIIPSELLN